MFCDVCGFQASAWVFQHWFCEWHCDIEMGDIPRCRNCESLGVTDSRNPYVQCAICQNRKLPLQEKPG